MLNESNIIKILQKAFLTEKNIVGIGDDAAVFPCNETDSYVVTKDILVENRHFRRATTSARDLAHKSLHVNLSDIAAMGATPLFALLGIAIPANISDEWINEFLSGFANACRQSNVHLIGGDTTGSGRDLFISVTVIGSAPKKCLKFRNGAKTGDRICVAGQLGMAYAGLKALETSTAGLDAVKQKSVRPVALTSEGIWFGTQEAVTAMTDVSDGLYVDLRNILESSRQGAFIDLEHLTASPELIEACALLKLDPREAMLVGGEDYALLFTVAADAYDQLAVEFQNTFGYAPMNIGEITSNGGLELREIGNPVPFTYLPFSHFGEL